ncbi:MAG TPA: circularly permuted type 2 ATP-grasp protein [Trebonia sp.]
MADIFDGYRLAEERARPANPIPRVIGAAEWDLVARGVRQRVRMLEAFLADVYGPGRAFDDGVLPWRLVFTSEKFRREVAGITPPNGVRVHVAGIDLIRDEQGDFRVLEDNVRVPSGVADPFVVVLTPGVHNAAYFEHTLLARLMGAEPVEGRDLFCWRNRVYVHTTHGRRPVDVIYRGVDDDWLDPLHFRPDSLLGCPGLVNAARRGTVTIANGIGSGVADDKLIYTYMPDLIRYYLGEEPVLANVESYRLDDPDVLVGEKLAPRHIDLRSFAVNDGAGVWVLPGGLTRVALKEGELTVNSSQGG